MEISAIVNTIDRFMKQNSSGKYSWYGLINISASLWSSYTWNSSQGFYVTGPNSWIMPCPSKFLGSQFPSRTLHPISCQRNRESMLWNKEDTRSLSPTFVNYSMYLEVTGAITESSNQMKEQAYRWSSPSSQRMLSKIFVMHRVSFFY